jgi:hypothetical protein
MFINKKIKRFYEKNNYLLFIFVFLNLLAYLLSYNQINYIHEIKYNFYRINKINNQSLLPLDDFSNPKFFIESLVSDLNKKNLVPTKFKVNEYYEASNKIMNLKVYNHKNYLVFQITSKKNLGDEEKKYFTYFENYLKFYLLEYLKEETKELMGLTNKNTPQGMEWNFNLLNSEINKLNYEREGITRNIKYTYIRNIFGIFNSIFIFIVFILYNKRQ